MLGLELDKIQNIYDHNHTSFVSLPLYSTFDLRELLGTSFNINSNHDTDSNFAYLRGLSGS
jgi:hypothetical protein